MAPLTATQLKEAGNALFVKKDFVRAHEKYTEAIAMDGQNAVLYANRSACSFGMGRFVEASRDALQATRIDPKYAKGWSRLATAHDAALEFTSAVVAWQNALEALPKTDLSPAEVTQKAQYTVSLEKAKQRLETVSSKPPGWVVSNMYTGKLPWQMAEEMMPELEAAGHAKYSSSAYVIHFANLEFTEGMGHMKSLKKVPMKDTPAGFIIVGHTSGLTCITNGLMRDRRVFRIDCVDWIEKCNGQICFEAEKFRAWTTENVEDIKKAALARLKKEGWNDTRPAFAVVVRGWMMGAFIDSEFNNEPHIAVERFKKILELLHWGRQVWKDVPKDDRGAIFQDTFVRGVKALYLETLMKAYMNAAAAADKEALLDTLFEASRELVEDMKTNTDALATMGFCFVQKAGFSDNPMEKKTCYLLAVKQYTEAAHMLPQDDEKYCMYLHYAVDPMLKADAPKHTIKNLVETIRVAMPKMQRIWANSAFAKQGRDRSIEAALGIAMAASR